MNLYTEMKHKIINSSTQVIILELFHNIFHTFQQINDFSMHQWVEAVISFTPREPVNNILLRAEYVVLSIQSCCPTYIQSLSGLPYE